jgi:hypothetical protein
LKKKKRPARPSSLAVLGGVAVLLPLVAGLAHAIVLRMDAGLLRQLPHWFWRATEAARPLWWLIVPIVALHLLAVWWIFKAPGKVALNLVLLILLGFLTQHGFAWMEGRGLEGMRDRLVNTGHGRFAWDAAKQPPVIPTLKDYRQLIEREALPHYPYATKPPGTLLAFMIAERGSRVLGIEDGFERLTTFAAVFFPLLSYLVVVPLFFLSRFFIDGPAAWVPPLLVAGAPNLTLITLHLDQCLYPLLLLTAVVLYVHAMRSRRLWVSLVAGIVACVALYFSFSLVVVLPLLILMSALDVVRRAGSDARFAILSVAAALAGVAVTMGLLRVALDYGTIETYRYAMANHQAWKLDTWTAATVVYVAFLNVLEFVLWTGLTLSWLAVDRMGAAVRRLRSGLSAGDAVVLAVLGILLVLAFFGRTVAETARLWLFLVPLFALLAGMALSDRLGKAARGAVSSVVVVQLVVTLATRLYQDFY